MACPACGAAADTEAAFCEACGSVIAGAVAGADAPTDGPADRRELDVSRHLGAVSDRGRVHVRNEDAVAVISGTSSSILVVCDGVSTSHDPARGSAIAAANSLAKSVAAGLESKEIMWAAILDAHEAVCGLVPGGTEDSGRPLTTIVAALVRADTAIIGWAGDSRAYLLSGGGKLLTRDDSWVNSVVECGDMTEAQAMHAPSAHAITHCLGDPDEAPDPTSSPSRSRPAKSSCSAPTASGTMRRPPLSSRPGWPVFRLRRPRSMCVAAWSSSPPPRADATTSPRRC